jgi:hypothetical protein
MTIGETLQIMAMISAFYGQGKSEPKTMARAWHIVLKDYDFLTTEQAVVQFAKNDQRDYATFPSVGQIVAAVEKERKMPRLIHNMATMNELYSNLPDRAKELISESDFEKIRKIEFEDALSYIKKNNKSLLGG